MLTISYFFPKGSMVEDIDQVRVLVRNLSSPEENEDDPGSGFYNFLISTFSDPGIPIYMT